jgi:hypothetical protein
MYEKKSLKFFASLLLCIDIDIAYIYAWFLKSSHFGHRRALKKQLGPLLLAIKYSQYIPL